MVVLTDGTFRENINLVMMACHSSEGESSGVFRNVKRGAQRGGAEGPERGA